MNTKLATLIAIVGLLAISGLAAASEHDTEPDESADTIFNFGYDEVNKILVWGTSPADDTTDCTLENGSVEVEYGSSAEGVIDTSFEGEEGCEVSGVSVPGPNGQVNHGMFMKAINSVYEGKGRGCINRYIAQSGFGKGDQQIRVPDVTPGDEDIEGAMGTIDFSTVLADCQRGNADETKLTGQEKAAAMKAAAAEKERGNSHSAPGRSGSSPGKSGLAQSNPDPAPGKSGSAPGRDK